MKRQTGLLTTGLVTAVLGLGIHALQGGGGDAPEASEAKAATQKLLPLASGGKAKSSGAADGAARSIADGPCAGLESLLQTFYAVTTVTGPAGCSEDGKGYPGELKAKTAGMQFAVAVVPDPLHTHFSLTFDRYAEAIQQGAQGEGYLYDSSWLPWETSEKDFALKSDADAAETETDEREAQPGLVLFRNDAAGARGYPQGLAVFVVGEEATSGVHREQFAHALEWMETLRAVDASRELRIIGPSFSGSLPSLAELIDAAPKEAWEHATLYSGAVTSLKAVNELAGDARIAFHGFQQPDDVRIEQYCRYLIDAGTPPDQIAVLSEDETAFGTAGVSSSASFQGSSASPRDYSCGGRNGMGGNRLVSFLYPRDISALRAAYQSQSLFTRGGASGAADATKRVLKTDLADPEGKQHDTIRSYSGSQTALSQESELQQIVRMLKAHRIRNILLRSSNPLDEIFLARYLQQSYPVGRIAVTSADMLLPRETEASGLTGVMVLSNYPLTAEGQDWTNPDPLTMGAHTHHAFTNSDAEATYVATRVMLGGATVAVGGPAFAPALCMPLHGAISEYSDPFWMHEGKWPGCGPGAPQDDEHVHLAPATWISVLGRGGFWPIAAIHADEEQRKHAEGNVWLHFAESVLFVRALRGRYSGEVLAVRGLSVPLSLTLTLLVTLGVALVHLWSCCNPTITQKPGFFAHFSRSPFLSGRKRKHRALLVIGSALLGCVTAVASWGMGSDSMGADAAIPGVAYRLLPVLVWAMGLVSLVTNVWIEERLEAIAGTDPPLMNVTMWQTLWPWKWTVQDWLAVVWRPAAWYVGVTFGFRALILGLFESRLHGYNRVETYIRSMNVNSGVSPIAPFFLLAAGGYCWFWFTLRGQALLGEDRPLLPKRDALTMAQAPNLPAPLQLTVLSREDVAEPAERWCEWISWDATKVFGGCFAAIVFGVGLIEWPPLRSLGNTWYSDFCAVTIAGCAGLLLTNGVQMLRVWLMLRELLQALDHLPLRRTMLALRGFSWGSIWSMGGSVLDERFKLYSRQVECANHLAELNPFSYAPDPTTAVSPVEELKHPPTPGAAWIWFNGGALATTREERVGFMRWYVANWNNWGARDQDSIQSSVQESYALLSGALLVRVLLPAWRQERDSLVADRTEEERLREHFPTEKVDDYVLAAEEFVCLNYVGFIQNVLGRIRSMVSAMGALLFGLALALASYPFDSRPLLNGFLVLLLLVLGLAVAKVYAEMFRNATLSRLTDTKPGELGAEFWMKIAGFGIGPLFGILASLFPAFSDFFFSWLQPGMGALK